jgi:hypothetical protein
MSLATLIEHPAEDPSGLRQAARRTPRVLWLVLAILLSWGVEYGVYSAFEPHGAALRHELKAAAAVLHTQLVLQPTPALRAAIREHFPAETVEVQTDGLWPPVVAVRLHGLTRDDCLNAVHDARRIDGPVVIALQGYGSATDCREENDMTWWLMP